MLNVIRHASKKIWSGEILNEEFLLPPGISAYRLAKETSIPINRVTSIIKGTRSISADTAIRLGKFFETSPQFWLGLQNDFDIEEKLLKEVFLKRFITTKS